MVAREGRQGERADGDGGGGGEERRGGEVTDIKSNNPHLTGGEIPLFAMFSDGVQIGYALMLRTHALYVRNKKQMMHENSG